MTHLLSLLCALAMLAGAVAFSRCGANTVSFVELGDAPAASASVPPQGSANLPA